MLEKYRTNIGKPLENYWKNGWKSIGNPISKNNMPSQNLFLSLHCRKETTSFHTDTRNQINEEKVRNLQEDLQYHPY
mgnify:CR=1